MSSAAKGVKGLDLLFCGTALQEVTGVQFPTRPLSVLLWFSGSILGGELDTKF
jgi:hypothetical protein